MDTSDWIDINPKISILYTKKKFFNKYFFRANYFVPGARLMTYYRSDDTDALSRRVDQYNSHAHTRKTWYGRMVANNEQIKDFSRLFHTKKGDKSSDDIKFRIEGCNFSIYTDTEENIFNIASKDLSSWKSTLRSISLIENSHSRALLDQGGTIVSKPQSHPYKVSLKETFNYSFERSCLMNYLQNLEDNVKVTEYILGRLSLENKYFPGGFVYVKDHRLIDMMRLVAPNLVGSVQILVTQ
jgi:hypothetical protein